MTWEAISVVSAAAAVDKMMQWHPGDRCSDSVSGKMSMRPAQWIPDKSGLSRVAGMMFDDRVYQNLAELHEWPIEEPVVPLSRVRVHGQGISRCEIMYLFRHTKTQECVGIGRVNRKHARIWTAYGDICDKSDPVMPAELYNDLPMLVDLMWPSEITNTPRNGVLGE